MATAVAWVAAAIWIDPWLRHGHGTPPQKKTDFLPWEHLQSGRGRDRPTNKGHPSQSQGRPREECVRVVMSGDVSMRRDF